MSFFEQNITTTSKLEKAGDWLCSSMRKAAGKRQYVWIPGHKCGYYAEIESPSISLAKRIAYFAKGLVPSLVGIPLKAVAKYRCTSKWLFNNVKKNQGCFHLEENTTCFEALKLGARRLPEEVLDNLQKFKLTQEETFELFKIAITSYDASSYPYPDDAWGLIEGYSRDRNFLSLSQKQRFEIAKIIISHYGPNCNIPTSLPLSDSYKAELHAFHLEQLKLYVKNTPPRSLLSEAESYLTSLSREEQAELLLLAFIYHPQYFTAFYHPNYFNTDRNQPRHLSEIAVKGEESSEQRALQTWKNRFISAKYINENLEFFPLNSNGSSEITPETLKTLTKTYFSESIAESITQEIKRIENPEYQVNTTTQVTSAIFAWKKKLSDEEFSWVTKQKLLTSICQSKTPHSSPSVILGSTQIAQEKSLRDYFETLEIRLEKKYPWMHILRVPLTLLKASGVPEETLHSFINALNQHRELSSAKLALLVQSLISLTEEQTLSPQEKEEVLQALIQGGKKALIDNVQALTSIFDWGNIHVLKDLKQGLTHAANALLQEAFSIQIPVENFRQRYADTFETYREPTALRTYLGTIKLLGNEDALKSLADHVVSVLDGSFLEKRYAIDQSPHLNKIPQETLDLWKENRVSSVYNGAKGNEMIDFQEWLKIKLCTDKHMTKPLPDLTDYLTNPSNQEAELKSKIQRERDPVQRQLLSLQQHLFSLMKCKTKKEQLLCLKTIEQMYSPLIAREEFLHDIRGQIQVLEQSDESFKKLTLHETDDPQDLLLCGTEVQGSCQRINGKPELNRGLLGYLAHGQTRLIAVKDEKGKIVARALLRLLLNDENQPVLFLERVYASKKGLENVITQAAKQKAIQLGCDLTQYATEGSYSSALHSLGGPAPFEYVDGAGGIQNKGKFTIPKGNLVLVN